MIAGVGGGFAALLLGVVLYIIFSRRRKAKKAAVLPFSEDSILHGNDSNMVMIRWASLYVNYHANYSFSIFCRKAFISLTVPL